MHSTIKETFLATALVCTVSLVSLTNDSLANGRFPRSTNIKFDPNDPSLMLVPATFGLLVSTDGGQSFGWVSEDTIGYGGVYDPDYALGANGDIYATTFDGLKRSNNGALSFENMNFFDPDSPTTTLDGIWVSEVEVANDGVVWATTSTGGKSNGVYKSTNGIDFYVTNLFDEVAWWRSIKLAPTNALVAYVSGFVVGQNGNPSQATLFKTIDGGTNWQELSTAGFEFGSQPNLVVEGVDPNDSEVVYVRSAFSLDNSGDSIYKSDNGGQTFTKVHQGACTIQAFTIRSDSSLILGSVTPCTGPCELDADVPQGCVQISPNGNADTFDAASELPGMNCVGESPHDKKLYSCGDAFGPEEFILGESTDDGQTWSTFIDNSTIVGPLPCPENETPETDCEETWPATCQFIGKCDEDSTTDSGSGDKDTDGDNDEDSDALCDCNSSSGGWNLFFILGIVCFAMRRQQKTQLD